MRRKYATALALLTGVAVIVLAAIFAALQAL